MFRHIVLCCALLLGGCATISDSNQQTVRVQTVQDNREVGGAGCLLQNKAGRWFVVTPGQVTITKSVGELSVDCKKDGASAGYDLVSSKLNASGLWGNLVVSAGLGYFVDKNTGAGYDYPSTLTVILRANEKPAAPEQQPGDGGTVIY